MSSNGVAYQPVLMGEKTGQKCDLLSFESDILTAIADVLDNTPLYLYRETCL